MTTGKRLRIAVWIVLIAIAGLAGVSYLHPFHARIPWGDSRLVAVSIIDGNLRSVFLSAELNMSYAENSPLVEYADHWEVVPTKAFTWNRSNQISFKGAPIRYAAFGVSLIPPILASLFVMWAVTRRRLIARSIREIMTPSDRHSVSPYRRVIRRLVVVIFGLATLLAVGSWVMCYTGLRTKYKRQLDKSTLRLSSSRGGHYQVTFSRRDAQLGPFLTIHLSASGVQVGHSSLVARGTIVPTYDFGLCGFRLRQRLDYLNATSVEFPCWAPVLLFSAWPVIAFLRGPYRRAARRSKGFCFECGYNLTGLVEPRCPECGTPTAPYV